MSFGFDYKQEQNDKTIEYFESLLFCMSDTQSKSHNFFNQPIEIIQIIQESINKLIIKLSFLISSNQAESPERNHTNSILVEKFYFILSNLIQNDARVISTIQNININSLPLCENLAQKLSNFSLSSNFLFTNLILQSFKYLINESYSILELLVQIQYNDQDFFKSLLQFHFNEITYFICNIVKVQYLSDGRFNFRVVELCLLILNKNSDLLITKEDDLSNFNILFRELLVSKLEQFVSNEIKMREIESIISFHLKLNINVLFIQCSSLIIANLPKFQIDSIKFFIELSTKMNFKILTNLVIKFIIKIMESDTKFDFESFLNNDESIANFIYQFISSVLIKTDKFKERSNDEENDQDILKNIFSLISEISSFVDSLPLSLCNIFVDYIYNQFYYAKYLSLAADREKNEKSNIIKKNVFLSLANLTTMTGFITDRIVSYDKFLEDIIDLIDESSFEIKFHICVVFSNLLFECSQYFEPLMKRINIVQKLKPLIWSSMPVLHREVCNVFINILRNVEKVETGHSISLELEEEGIIESMTMMLNNDIPEFNDKSYIFELSEVLGHYLLK